MLKGSYTGTRTSTATTSTTTTTTIVTGGVRSAGGAGVEREREPLLRLTAENEDSSQERSDSEKRSTMSMASGDPYYAVRDELSSTVRNMQARLDQLQTAAAQPGARPSEIKAMIKALSRDVKSTEKGLRGLSDTIDQVEAKREDFLHIEDSDLESRRRFVATTTQQVQDIRSVVDRMRAQAKENQEHKAKLKAEMESSNPRTAANARFVDRSQTQAHELLARQDEELEHLDVAVDKVGQIARGIHGELEEQNKMINELEDDIEEVSSRYEFVMGRLEVLLKTKDRCQVWTIIILILILLALIAAVFML